MNPVAEAALEDVNTIRTACGVPRLKDLPKGHVGEGNSCPIANALKDIAPEISVHGGIAYGVEDLTIADRIRSLWTNVSDKIKSLLTSFKSSGEKGVVPLTEATAQFVEDFDGGELPEYEKDPYEDDDLL